MQLHLHNVLHHSEPTEAKDTASSPRHARLWPRMPSVVGHLFPLCHPCLHPPCPHSVPTDVTKHATTLMLSRPCPTPPCQAPWPIMDCTGTLCFAPGLWPWGHHHREALLAWTWSRPACPMWMLTTMPRTPSQCPGPHRHPHHPPSFLWVSSVLQNGLPNRTSRIFILPFFHHIGFSCFLLFLFPPLASKCLNHIFQTKHARCLEVTHPLLSSR